MQSIWKSKGKKLHKRKIEVTTYDYDGQRIIVEGFLKDGRFQESYMMFGDILPSGVIHHMSIRLLVNCSNFLVEDVDVDLISVPQEMCRETINCLAPIKGMAITKGFTLKAKKVAGGNKGCTHLLELLQAMTPAIFHGLSAHQSQKPSVLDYEQVKKIIQPIFNTCRAWCEDGPFVEMFKKKFNKI